ncbi:MAG: hypothetical protein M1816_000737 [Peltula sp. TS41687]|nr:MAG: hypothetical protein M1816_000737 [Peltula sp. TS41687]
MAASEEHPHCILLDLPAEMLRDICDLLIPPKTVLSFEQLDRKIWPPTTERDRSKVKTIHESLPCLADLLSLSGTCSFYRAVLAPHIFKVVYLHNTGKSGLAVQALASSPCGGLVKELRYCGVAPGLSQGKDAFSDTEAVFPPEVAEVLSHLNRFPNLQKLYVEFPFDYDEGKEPYDFLEETPHEVATAESEKGWRALMAKSFLALAQNASGSVPSLELGRLHPLAVSTFDHDCFHDFLCSLKSFSLTVRGWDNGRDRQLSTTWGFLMFAEELDDWFFNHLCSVTDLTLEADETAPIGLAPGTNYVPLALKAEQMPQLRSIDLKYIVVCKELIDFLTSHLNTLESIKLRDCFCSVNGLSEVENPPYWHHLFSALVDARPERLTMFKVSKSNLDGWQGFDPISDADYRRACRVMEEGGRRMFAYMNLDLSTGDLFLDGNETIASLLRGDDLRAYDELMQVVDEKREEGRLSRLGGGLG